MFYPLGFEGISCNSVFAKIIGQFGPNSKWSCRGSTTYTNAVPLLLQFWLMHAQVGVFCISRGSPTVPQMRILCNAGFEKSQNPRNAGTLCTLTKLLHYLHPLRQTAKKCHNRKVEPLCNFPGHQVVTRSNPRQPL